MSIEIITNSKPRELISWFDLTKKERSNFDWIEEPEESGYEFFRYKKRIYSLDKFTVINKNNPFYNLGYDEYLSDSFSSGILIKLDDTNESVVCATYYS